jgi:alpha-amylase/alpha-mannosidase (GH57 family)
LILIKACLRANEQRLIERFKPYKILADMARDVIEQPDILCYYSEQFLSDLLVWYHLAWIGETVRRNNQQIDMLMEKERLYTVHDRRILVEEIHKLVSTVIVRYKSLAETGQIELSMTPYAHPIMPLLQDIESAGQAMPDVSLPINRVYPDGDARCRWHMQKGMETFKHFFGFYPQGCWPSEGSISAQTTELLSDMGVRWLASGETVLRNSMHKSDVLDEGCIHTAYTYRDNSITCFFRDDGLSDLIGFKYSNWHADDAVANLIHHLENIAEACKDREAPIVSIILDGENAWEYYPENGYYFLTALYAELAKHETIKLTTYSDYLDQHTQSTVLSEMVGGSWVYGTFSTWIGSDDKNRAWDMLVEAKKMYDRVLASGRLTADQLHRAEIQLAICEGSDWFWWFGDYNPADSVSAFDQQYRLHLSNLFDLLGEQPPEYLSHAFSHGSMAPAAGGVMLPGKQHTT